MFYLMNEYTAEMKTDLRLDVQKHLDHSRGVRAVNSEKMIRLSRLEETNHSNTWKSIQLSQLDS